MEPTQGQNPEEPASKRRQGPKDTTEPWNQHTPVANLTIRTFKKANRVFLGGTVVKNPAANAGDTGSSPGPGRSHMPWSN